jgi:uncharacterized DUF497 family protein
MQDGAFEWDDGKAARNWLKHRVSFELAREVFGDVFAIEWMDDAQDAAEARFITVVWWRIGLCSCPTR